MCTHTHKTILRLCGFCLGQPGWAGTRRNIHPLTLIVLINHPYLLSPPTTIHGILPIQSTCFTVFFHNLSPSFLLTWHPPLHTPYISSPNHYLLFATRSIATCFAVVPRLYHLNLVSLSTLYSELYLVTSHHTSILPFSSLPSEVPPHFPFLQARSHSMQHTALHTTAVQSHVYINE